jgi:hypothetical protein
MVRLRTPKRDDEDSRAAGERRHSQTLSAPRSQPSLPPVILPWSRGIHATQRVSIDSGGFESCSVGLIEATEEDFKQRLVVYNHGVRARRLGLGDAGGG